MTTSTNEKPKSKRTPASKVVIKQVVLKGNASSLLSRTADRLARWSDQYTDYKMKTGYWTWFRNY